MRIALDSIAFGLQRLGGITTYWVQLVRGLAAREDVAPVLIEPRTVITRHGDKAALPRVASVREAIPNVLSRYLPAPTIPGCGVQHSSYYRLPRHRNVKAVVTVYDFIYETHGRGPARWVHGAQKRHAVEGAEAVICISNRTREELLQRWPDINSAKVVVVPLAVDHDRWCPDGPEQRRPGPGDQVLFVGRRDRYKRFDLAVAAVERVPGLQLIVIGPDLTRSEEVMLRTRLRNQVQFLGEIDDRALRLLYASAYALVMPSESEGFGLPLLEAMACGCPVVANRASGLAESGGSAARWVRAQDADAYAEALLALSHRETREAAVQAGLSRAATFTWKASVEQTVAIYRQVA